MKHSVEHESFTTFTYDVKPRDVRETVCVPSALARYPRPRRVARPATHVDFTPDRDAAKSGYNVHKLLLQCDSELGKECSPRTIQRKVRIGVENWRLTRTTARLWFQRRRFRGRAHRDRG